MMNLLVVSNVVLWAMVLVLAFIVFALTRQIGVLYERVAPAGALAVNKKLEAGQDAPAMALQTLDNKLVDIAGNAKTKRSQLLFFVSPVCPVCKTLLPALKSAAEHESDWLDVILASDGTNLDHSGFVRQYDLQAFPYVVSEFLGKSYGVAKLPYAALIDEDGKVASLGIVNSREHLDSLFEAKDRKVASIQEYLAQKSVHS